MLNIEILLIKFFLICILSLQNLEFNKQTKTTHKEPKQTNLKKLYYVRIYSMNINQIEMYVYFYFYFKKFEY
jgi:hypothetical protein